MKFLFSFSFLTAFISSGMAQTWNQDIAPIVYDHCGKCHHEGGIAPSPLLTYADAFNQADDIMTQVTEGTMPPWPANHNYQHFIGENVLSQEEIDLITAWVNADSPEGTGSAPTPPSYQDGYQLASPDEIVGIPAYQVASDEDVYRMFTIPSTSNVDRYIGSIEFDPDNDDIVHHVLAFYDPSNVSAALDAADPLPGFESNGGSFPSDDAVLIGVWVPGMGFTSLPENLAIPLPAGADFVFEIHYAPSSLGQQADVKMRLDYKEMTSIREVYNEPLLVHFAPSLQEPELFIPANTIQTFHEQSQVAPVPLSLISVFPHMHLLGKTFKVYGLTPQQDTVRVVDVDSYDFHWQFSYTFPTMKKLPIGSRLYGEATYDNTEANDDNPNFPPEDVSLGENTTDEMMVCFLLYTVYQVGDENISLVNVPKEQMDPNIPLFVFPNPAKETLLADLPNTIHKITDARILNVQGQTIQVNKEFSNGRLRIDTSSLANGFYQLIVNTDEGVYQARFIKE